MAGYHKVLEKQIKECLGEKQVTEGYSNLLSAISETYFKFEKGDQLSQKSILSELRDSENPNTLKSKLNEIERKNRLVSIINSVSKNVHSTINLDEVIRISVESIKDNLDNIAMTSLYFIENDNAVLKSQKGFPEWLLDIARCVPYPKGFIWKTVGSGSTRYCPEAKYDEDIGPVSERLGINSYVSIPLRLESKIIGVLNVSASDTDAFKKDELNLLEVIASLIEDAIGNARLADERKGLISELESTVQQLKETQQELIVQEKLASLGILTAGIAHEIKNPLNFVNNFSDLSIELLDELEGEIECSKDDVKSGTHQNILDLIGTIKQNCIKINEHGKRADRIVQSMLAHSRNKKSEKQYTDINTLIDDNIGLAYHGIRARNENFNTFIDKSYDKSIGKINIVAQDISRVILNILTNAFYALAERSRNEGADYDPKIEIKTYNLPEEVEIYIRDNGPGIPVDIQQKVFTHFFTTKPAGHGTGLGLSISYEIIVQEHGGSLKLESKEGNYTEFKIKLPKN